MQTGKGDMSAGRGDYNQLSAQSSELFNTYLPILQQLLPELQNTANGNYTPLTAAAQAPVIAQTNQGINTADNSIGGSAPTTAARFGAAETGQQNAALASASMMQSVLQALTSLTGPGLSNAQQGTATAAAGLTGIGQSESQGFSSAISSLLPGIGKLIAPGTPTSPVPTGQSNTGTNPSGVGGVSDPIPSLGLIPGVGNVGAGGGAISGSGASVPASTMPTGIP